MQKNNLKKSLFFSLPVVITTAIIPLTSISCSEGKYSYLDDIKFKLINPSITTNKEIADEFKKNKESIKKYIDISNPNKYDIEIRDVKPEGNDAILIDFKTSNHGKNVWDRPDRPYRISGLKDPSKEWDNGSLKTLSEVLLEQIKNNPKDFIDLQNSEIKDKFPSDIRVGMIKFKSSIAELISRKLPKVDLVVNIQSNDNVKGAISLSLELKTKNGNPFKIAKNNITLSTNDGLLSLDDLTSKLTVNDLNLPTDIGELLPSEFKFENNNIFKKESILKNDKYSNVNIKDISYDDKDAEGIKTVSFRLEHNNQSTKLINLPINKFYSTKQFDELVESLTADDLDINPDTDMPAYNYDISSIKLKSNSQLLKQNKNLFISNIIRTPDHIEDGVLCLDITIEDKHNKSKLIKTIKNVKINGFFMASEFLDQIIISDIRDNKSAIESIVDTIGRSEFDLLNNKEYIMEAFGFETNFGRRILDASPIPFELKWEKTEFIDWPSPNIEWFNPIWNHLYVHIYFKLKDSISGILSTKTICVRASLTRDEHNVNSPYEMEIQNIILWEI